MIGIEECLLTTDLGNAIRLAVRDWAREEKLEPYDQATGEGYLRHLVYREGRNTGQALVVLVTAPGERFETGYFVDVLRRFPEVRSIHWAINDTPAERTNLPTPPALGRRRDRGGRSSGCASGSARTRSCRRTRRWPSGCTSSRASTRGSTGTENVFDLYCGTGTIGLSLARDASTVWGVEISEESVACAIENAELNGIENAQLLRGQRRADARGARRAGGVAATSSSSIRRAQASRARRCGGLVRCRRPGSSTSPATRRRSPRT